jgi:hypothetical protein
MFWNKKEEGKSLPELPPMKPAFRPMAPDSKEEVIEESILPAAPEEHVAFPKLKQQPRAFQEFAPKRFVAELKPASKVEDVYVKIDRFHSARKALTGARNKLAEIEEVMRKIRETRMREEQELASWEKDIDSVKSKVEDVTKNIFEKIE